MPESLSTSCPSRHLCRWRASRKLEGRYGAGSGESVIPAVPSEYRRGAECLDVPARWVAEAVRQRRVGCTRIDKHVRFEVEHIAELVEAGEQPVTRSPLRTEQAIEAGERANIDLVSISARDLYANRRVEVAEPVFRALIGAGDRAAHAAPLAMSAAACFDPHPTTAQPCPMVTSHGNGRSAGPMFAPAPPAITAGAP